MRVWDTRLGSSPEGFVHVVGEGDTAARIGSWKIM